MSFVLLSKMATLKNNHIRHTINSIQKSTTIMPVISQVLNNRLIGREFSSKPLVPMLKREDYQRTKHDAIFSDWEILIGSTDWEDSNNGKEGVSRYRLQNLPSKDFTGLYELGVAVIDQDLGQNLDPDNVLATYLGQSVDVRSRLQDYGRCGAHFPVYLFLGTFSKRGSILYRYAQMESKSEAVATEGKILMSTFDYAWNTCNNGGRRQIDLLKKLGDREFMSKRKTEISQVGIRIKGEKHVVKEERKLSCDVDEVKSNNFLTSILKMMRPNWLKID